MTHCTLLGCDLFFCISEIALLIKLPVSSAVLLQVTAIPVTHTKINQVTLTHFLFHKGPTQYFVIWHLFDVYAAHLHELK